MESDINLLVDLVQSFGTGIMFLYLFLKEREAHERTRTQHLIDLRDIAGMSDRLRPSRDDVD